MHRLTYLAVVLLAFIGGTTSVEMKDVFNNSAITDLIGSIPGVSIPSEITQIENMVNHIEDAKQALKDKCKKESGREELYDEVYAAGDEYKKCIEPLLDFSTIKAEMEEAQPKGDLDTVFNKYCARRHSLLNCTRTFTTKIEPCLSAKEITNKNIVVNMFNKALDFVCHKEGDQIALFIAEKGPECFKDKNEDMQRCIKEVFGEYVPKDKSTINLKVIPTFEFDRTKCQDMESLSGCMVKSLETCEESTPANLVESMFRFVKNETPCKKLLSRQARSMRNGYGDESRSAASSLGISLTLIGAAVSTYIYA